MHVRRVLDLREWIICFVFPHHPLDWQEHGRHHAPSLLRHWYRQTWTSDLGRVHHLQRE